MMIASPKGVLTPGKIGRQNGSAKTIITRSVPISPAASKSPLSVRGHSVGPWSTKVLSVVESGCLMRGGVARAGRFLIGAVLVASLSTEFMDDRGNDGN